MLAAADIQPSGVHVTILNGSAHKRLASVQQKFRCHGCRLECDQEQFLIVGEGRALHNRSGGGTIVYLHPLCDRCRTAQRARLNAHPVASSKTLRPFLRRLASRTRANVKSRGLLFVLTELDLLECYIGQDGRCALSGARMTAPAIGLGVGLQTAAVLDRLDHAGHFVRDNIQLVCRVMSDLRGSLSYDDLRLWCARVTLHASGESVDD